MSTAESMGPSPSAYFSYLLALMLLGCLDIAKGSLCFRDWCCSWMGLGENTRVPKRLYEHLLAWSWGLVVNLWHYREFSGNPPHWIPFLSQFGIWCFFGAWNSGILQQSLLRCVLVATQSLKILLVLGRASEMTRTLCKKEMLAPGPQRLGAAYSYGVLRVRAEISLDLWCFLHLGHQLSR